MLSWMVPHPYTCGQWELDYVCYSLSSKKEEHGVAMGKGVKVNSVVEYDQSILYEILFIQRLHVRVLPQSKWQDTVSAGAESCYTLAWFLHPRQGRTMCVLSFFVFVGVGYLVLCSWTWTDDIFGHWTD